LSKVKQLPTDGKVAAVLCVGQPVKYKLKADTAVTRGWLLTNVVPGIHEFFEDDAANRIADVLALPLLWACLDERARQLVPPEVSGRVRANWTAHCLQHELDQQWNPVEKVILQVHRYENQLVIDELLTVQEVGRGDGGANGDVDPLVVANRAAGNMQQLSILTNQVHQLKLDHAQAKMELQEAIAESRSYNVHQFTLLHKTFGKLLHQAPTRRVPGGVRPANAATAVGLAAGAGREPAQLRAGLSKCPRSLHDLWREWTDGLDGNKPASQLKVSERGGKMRYVYHNRKFAWDVIKRFTDKNVSHLTAIDNIETAYGRNKSVSHYISCIKRDRRTGGHPNLALV
jgi:Transcriptional activator of glycolytic enzymes